MSQKILCKQCGHENEVTSLFCRDCGAKLDHGNLKADEFIRPEKPGLGAFRRLLGIIQLVVLVAIIVAAGFAFWPTYPIGEAGSLEMAREFREKMERQREAIDSGIGMQIVVLEREINGYLRAMVDKHLEEAPSGGFRAELEEANVALNKENVYVSVHTRLGPVPIVYSLSGTPVMGESGFYLDVSEAHLGHLPMPGPLQGFVEGKVEPIFVDLKAERYVLDELERIELANARARLTNTGRQ